MNFLRIDLGTSSVKIIIMNDNGKVSANVSKSYPISYLKVGWAEQNPENWWNSTKEGIKELLNQSSVKAEDIRLQVL
jgi:xylulokinase